MAFDYDFCGWATKNNIKCSDGRTIRENAFKHNDGQVVPMVWNHQHNDPLNVLGHAMLENRKEGVYAYGKFNETEAGQAAKSLVQHGDVTMLSIYANQLKQRGGDVLHGSIREVSLVLAGANSGATIESIISHADGDDEEAVICTGDEIELAHADCDTKHTYEEKKEDKPVAEEVKKPDGEKTVQDVFNTLNEEQKTVVYALIGQAIEDAKNGGADDEEDSEMKHNIFDNDDNRDVLSHSEMEAVINDGKRYGSLKESALAHGISSIDYLFPEAHNLNTPPEFIKRDTNWVSKVMGAVHHTPFSRIKSTFADITEDEARARGYFGGTNQINAATGKPYRDAKGNLVDKDGNRVYKKEEVFSLLKRTTTPTTIYKKQKLDRDDVIDITDFDVVAWLKAEMRVMLDEEIARAVLIGDGRLASSDDKINETCIRPIATDADLYTIKVKVTDTGDDSKNAKAFIRAAIKARKNYKGSGEPVLYCTEDILTDMLLIEDKNERVIYDSIDKLANALRVKAIVTVPVMENVNGANNLPLMGIIVNLSDYNIGADKGGSVNMFDDFDIDYNAQKYLIETRCSGALIKPKSAITIELEEADDEEAETSGT